MAKRGRKVGAVSFCKVALSELNRVLKPEATVIVSVKFAAMLGVSGSKLEIDDTILKAVTANKDADIKLVSWDADTGLRPTIEVEDFNEF